MKRKNLSFIQKQKERSSELRKQLTEKGVYQTIKIPSDVTSILCGQEEWK